jgi:hypothetical protein
LSTNVDDLDTYGVCGEGVGVVAGDGGASEGTRTGLGVPTGGGVPTGIGVGWGRGVGKGVP